jgi:methanogenic corrinoid protein MtbC1
MASSPSKSAEYSIAAVSKLTGIGCHSLRVWERRYDFPVPNRSPSGHRRYTSEQVQALDRVAAQLREGDSLNDVMAQIRAGSTVLAPQADSPSPPSSVDGLLSALQRGDLDAAELAFENAIDGLSKLDRILRVLQPAFIEVGERWFRGESQVFQEHFATEFLRRKLAVLLDEVRQAGKEQKRTAILATVQGDRHEGGILMFGLILELHGWRGISLGVDLPTTEIQKAVDLWKPDAVCVSFVLSRNVNKRFVELSRVTGAPVYVGGRSIVNYQGLARRHGLHPLPGSGEEAAVRMITEIEAAGTSALKQ